MSKSIANNTRFHIAALASHQTRTMMSKLHYYLILQQFKESFRNVDIGLRARLQFIEVGINQF